MTKAIGMSSRKKWRTLRTLIDSLLVMAFAIGVCALTLEAFLPALSNLGIHFATIEFPIGYQGHLFVDSKGRIYCYNHSYGRLQVYDRRGVFMGGSFTGRGLLPISEPNEDALHVVTVADWHVIFDSAARETKKWREKGAYRELARRYGGREYGCEDIDGNNYTIHNGLFLTRIVKTTPEGERTVVVKELARFFPIRSPFPAVLFVGVPIAVWVVRSVLKKKRARRQCEKATPDCNSKPIESYEADES